VDGEVGGLLSVSTHEPLLGTVVEIRVVARDELAVEAVDHLVVGEMRRLEGVFSVYDDGSELCRWRRGEVDAPSRELVGVLAAAAIWHRRGGGAFHPCVGELKDLWNRAAAEQRVPAADALAACVVRLSKLPYVVVVDVDSVGGVARVHQVADCSNVDLNAIAKGAIVDIVTRLGMRQRGVVSLVVNAGGDLLHRGTGSVVVGIENPARPYDNEPPLAVVHISDGAVATSGSARRGWRIDGKRFGHVLDPRTGRPVESVASVSVAADDAITADAVATVVGVLGPEAGLAFAAGVDGVGCLVVDSAGQQWSDEVWQRLSGPR
jgi:FAD:protein FMN transferase